MSDAAAVEAWIEGARDELVEFVLSFGNVSSPRGDEGDASRFLRDWLDDSGVDARLQPVVGDRANVIASLEGDGSAAGLLLNGHLDTAHGNPEEDGQVLDSQPRAYRECWRDGPFLKGDGVVNDKGPLGAAAFALIALDRAGVSLSDDVVLTGSVGEISGTTVGEFDDPERYAGSGLGTRHLVDSGVTGEYALVAECTGFSVARMECGVVWLEITLQGDSTYHPLLARDDAGERSDVVDDLARAITALEAWGEEYRREHTVEYDHGTVRPTASVGAVRSGKPYSPAAAPGSGTIYFDVRLPPGETPSLVRGEIESRLDDLGVEATVEPYLFRRGYVADPDAVTGLVDPLEAAHERVRGGKPTPPSPHVTSMWRDSNVFNEVGVPSVNYGPPRTPDAFPDSGLSDAIRVDDLVSAAKIYARTALAICG
jgi:acetylornithine deacetylase/succinyl-diaminopimelate desuccinylase-like protein